MTGLGALIRRNTKLYFKDRGMFFSSLITLGPGGGRSGGFRQRH